MKPVVARPTDPQAAVRVGRVPTSRTEQDLVHIDRSPDTAGEAAAQGVSSQHDQPAAGTSGDLSAALGAERLEGRAGAWEARGAPQGLARGLEGGTALEGSALHGKTPASAARRTKSASLGRSTVPLLGRQNGLAAA